MSAKFLVACCLPALILRLFTCFVSINQVFIAFTSTDSIDMSTTAMARRPKRGTTDSAVNLRAMVSPLDRGLRHPRNGAIGRRVTCARLSTAANGIKER